MRSEDPSSRRVAAPLIDRVGAHATAQQTATAFERLWSELDAALSPIIGRRGVDALGQRSLKLASAEHPWLAAGQPVGSAPFDPLPPAALMAQHSPAQAQAAGDAFLQTFHGLLTSLVGVSLTDRLLHPVWHADARSHPNSPPGQDPTP
jgi:hypothetical protein